MALTEYYDTVVICPPQEQVRVCRLRTCSTPSHLTASRTAVRRREGFHSGKKNGSVVLYVTIWSRVESGVGTERRYRRCGGVVGRMATSANVDARVLLHLEEGGGMIVAGASEPLVYLEQTTWLHVIANVSIVTAARISILRKYTCASFPYHWLRCMITIG
jgi:hypothetical protein